MDVLGLTVIAVGIIAFGLISRRLQDSVITPPMVFIVFGLAIGSGGFGLADFEFDHGVIHTLAEATLILVLFTDAARIDLRLLWKQHDIPVRLLAIGMPVTIVLGTLVGLALFPEMGLIGAAILAAVLAPTDAALGQAVVSNAKVPVRIRQALNVESGLNDGIALPLILLLACLYSAEHAAGTSTGFWLQFGITQVTLGPLVGWAVGYLGGKAIDTAGAKGWMTDAFEGLSGLALAFVAYLIADQVGGNGFIAAFVAGLGFGHALKRHCPFVLEFCETEGQLLTLLTFLIFGAALLPEGLHHIDALTVLYAVLSLTVIRMVPIALSLVGKGMRPATVLFLGWFGPRGLASILFALLVIEQINSEVAAMIGSVTMVTVALSALLHGLSAAPMARRYAAMLEKARSGTEHHAVDEIPARVKSY